MTVLSVGAGALAHSVHYGVLGVGLLGLLALLGPQLVGVRRSPVPADDHDRRVHAVQRQIATGSLGLAVAPAPLPPAPTLAPVPFSAGLLPIAVVSSAAAAGAHAAVGPPHFGEQMVIGLFFTGLALAQILWALTIVLRPSPTLLTMALLGNGAVLALWLVTRVTGLPGGLLPQPQAIGPWDLACAVWELAILASCAYLLLRRGTSGAVTLRFLPWATWPRSAQSWALGSALVLGLLSISGAAA